MTVGSRSTDREKRGQGTDPEKERPRDTRAACSAAGLLDTLRHPELVDQAISDRDAEFRAKYEPQDGVEDWLIHDLARNSFEIDIQKARLVRDTVRLINRAEKFWEDDRKSEALDLMARISASPARIAAALEGTKQGVDILLDYYENLRNIIAKNGAIDDRQRSLIFDIMGVAQENREGNTRVPAADDGPKLAELVARQIQRLESRRDNELVAQDRVARNNAIKGISLTPDAVTRRLKRDLAAATRGFNAAYKLLMEGRQLTGPATTPCGPATETPGGQPAAAAPPTGSRPVPPAPPAAADSGSLTSPADAACEPVPVTAEEQRFDRIRDEFAARLTGEEQQAFLVGSQMLRAHLKELQNGPFDENDVLSNDGSVLER